MTIDLRPNKKIEPYQSGSFSWGWFADNGVFLAIGHGPVCRRRYAGRVGIPQKGGVELLSNDGYKVTAAEAKAIARAAWGLYEVESWKLREWKRMPEAERQRRLALPLDQQCGESWIPSREDFVEKAHAFAWFAFASGGFRVY